MSGTRSGVDVLILGCLAAVCFYLLLPEAAPFALLSLAVAVLVALAPRFAKLTRTRTTVDGCANPNCVRCQRYAVVLQNAVARLDALDAPRCSNQLRGAILSACYTNSTHTGEPKDKQRQLVDLVSEVRAPQRIGLEMQAPTLLNVGGLPSVPWPPTESVVDGWEDDWARLHRDGLIESLQREWREKVAVGGTGEELPWQRNTTPTGVWAILPLVSQGQPDRHVVKASPVAAALASQLEHCMARPALRQLVGQQFTPRDSCVFANVMWSVLWPDSSIEPHCGPTNVRWRVHIPVCIESKATVDMTVGGTTRYVYSTGERGMPCWGARSRLRSPLKAPECAPLLIHSTGGSVRVTLWL